MRCSWANNELAIKYHDKEWCKISKNDSYIFEMLMLESFQAGLSWDIILKKRENFRSAFDNFDYKKISDYDENKIEELLQNEGIIRHKLKISATINNAKKFIEIQKEFGTFANYIWDFVEGKQIINNWKEMKEVPVKTELSDKISRDLKKRGFKFVGSTIIYSFLQAIGIIDDHIEGCFCKK